MQDVERIYANAQLYDQEFSSRREDIPYYRDLALKTDGPILEIACGTGRLTIPIAESGKQITGVDLVASMLAKAQQAGRIKGLTIDFLQQDCRHLSLGRKFPFIFCAANALQHLLDTDDALLFLKAARAHLDDQGLFVLEVFNPDPVRLGKSVKPYTKKSFVSDAGNTVVQCASHYDRRLQRLNFVYIYEAEGREILRKEISIRCFFPQELRLLLSIAGFEIKKCDGNYDGSAFDEDSPLQIYHCLPITL